MGCRCMNSLMLLLRPGVLGLRGYSLYEMRWLGTFCSLGRCDRGKKEYVPAPRDQVQPCTSVPRYLGIHVPLYHCTCVPSPLPVAAPGAWSTLGSGRGMHLMPRWIEYGLR